ncbi:hypothetical protein CRYUN_Cryun25bG0086900 [Craigia yunnanensis]
MCQERKNKEQLVIASLVDSILYISSIWGLQFHPILLFFCLVCSYSKRERETGTLSPNSIAVHEAGEDDQVYQVSQQQKELDAGALFVLKSKGSWVHCGYHLTTSIVAPALLSLPFAFTFLRLTAGILCLVIGALVTFYSYNLLSLVLEHHAQLGRRQLRFRDLANDILGKH